MYLNFFVDSPVFSNLHNLYVDSGTGFILYWTGRNHLRSQDSFIWHSKFFFFFFFFFFFDCVWFVVDTMAMFFFFFFFFFLWHCFTQRLTFKARALCLSSAPGYITMKKIVLLHMTQFQYFICWGHSYQFNQITDCSLLFLSHSYVLLRLMGNTNESEQHLPLHRAFLTTGPRPASPVRNVRICREEIIAPNSQLPSQAGTWEWPVTSRKEAQSLKSWLANLKEARLCHECVTGGRQGIRHDRGKCGKTGTPWQTRPRPGRRRHVPLPSKRRKKQ